ncbi:MAG: ketoacyl-ACP synthase III [Gammaproteobacteria bacterium]|nr:ketoacyl-ACP synthase III [Gammaproteobacteria bacterium]
MIYSRITGTGGYLPQKVLTNHDLERMFETSDEWITSRTGIRERHIVADGESTVDLAEASSRLAMEAAGVGPKEIDLIIVATTTPDQIFPSTATQLQYRLGVHEAPAFDVQAVCTGFIYALSVADKFIKSGSHRCALVVGAESMSRVVDWNDRGTAILFGDGSGAAVVQADSREGILSTHIHADGQYRDLLYVPPGEKTLLMQGNEVFRMAVNTLGRIVDETLEANRLQKEEIDWLVPHQANIRIINATARKLKMAPERVVVTVDIHGNTSAASVPLALDVAVRDGRIIAGDLLLLEAFGGGFTWGSVLLRF